MGVIASSRLIEELQKQYNFERYSAEVYTHLAGCLEVINLTGMASYLLKRAEEERAHAHKFYAFLADRGVRPILEALPAPDAVTPLELLTAGQVAFAAAHGHEKIVTMKINALYDCAFECDDPATVEFLHWFVREQVEEERTLEEILTRFRLAQDNGAAVLLIDQSLGGK